MDIERILSIQIPDIAPVYGGVRGRTISLISRHTHGRRLWRQVCGR